jgi:light-regulated signal transduction histidine kinase (bacteriophytochrome)
MITDCNASLDDNARTYLARMVSASGRMQMLITDILSLSRIRVAARSVARVDLAQIVREVIGDLEVGIRESSADVQVANLPTIEADASQMRQLFQNLLSNAIKFRRPDVATVVRMTSALAPAQETLGILSPAFYQISIADNGIGFETRHSEIIFGAFQRLHPRGTYVGTGMGLTICRKIVECHGGTITAKSQAGMGTEFHITLPVRQLHAR